MLRDLTSGMSTNLQSGVIRPVLIGRLGFVSDPIISWTGPGIFAPSGSGDPALDGQTFAPMLPALKMTPIQEDMGIGQPVTLAVTGNDLDDPALRQVVRDKRQWLLKKAYLWLGLLDADEHSVIADPVRIKTGYMTEIETERKDKTNEVRVTIDEDLGNARSAPFRWIDHTRLFPSDTFSTFIIKLANKPRGLESSDVNNTGGSGAGDPGRHGPMRLF